MDEFNQHDMGKKPDQVGQMARSLEAAASFFRLLEDRQIEICQAGEEWWWSLPDYGIQSQVGYPDFGHALWSALYWYSCASR